MPLLPADQAVGTFHAAQRYSDTAVVAKNQLSEAKARTPLIWGFASIGAASPVARIFHDRRCRVKPRARPGEMPAA